MRFGENGFRESESDKHGSDENESDKDVFVESDRSMSFDL
jgi:hypothetical protein